MTPALRSLFLVAAMLVAACSFADEPVPEAKPQPVPADPAPTTVNLGPADRAECCSQCIAEYGTLEDVRSSACFAEFLVGDFHRSSQIGPAVPRFDYVPIVFRLGIRPHEDGGFFMRRISLMAEFAADPVTGSFGNYMTGPSVLVRFDACPDSRICPYLQGGTGFVLTDAYHDPNQRAIGEEFEFLQQVEVGVRCKLTDNLAIESEFGLQHVSNGGLANRNYGANALGVSIGLRWTFGAR